jgi:dTDP-4-dehydrorhamnose 3,5-epimerase
MTEHRRLATRIDGTYVLESTAMEDERGWVGELLRRRWIEDVEFVQWNLVRSVAGALRGMHWHELHHDLIAPVAGTVLVGLSDLRPGSPTERQSELLEVDASCPAAVIVPPGVAHGLYSRRPTTLLYAVSRYWDPDDEFGVAFDDPELGLDWPFGREAAILSERDRAMPRLADVEPGPRYATASSRI